MRCATRWTWPPWKNFLIGELVARYGVDLDEALDSDPAGYRNFNAFFTRALKPGARPMPDATDAIVSPADGFISQVGSIMSGRIVQAKRHEFSVAELLGDASIANRYTDGSFLTVYLSPRDYHRVHMPMRGRLIETLHVPGRIFSVQPFAIDAIPRLFARNERLVCHFESDFGPFVVVLVGALLVSGIQTVWGGVEVPPYASRPKQLDYSDRKILLARGEELGRFNMGSTVIMLLPNGSGWLDVDLSQRHAVRVGECIGNLNSAKCEVA